MLRHLLDISAEVRRRLPDATAQALQDDILPLAEAKALGGWRCLVRLYPTAAPAVRAAITDLCRARTEARAELFSKTAAAAALLLRRLDDDNDPLDADALVELPAYKLAQKVLK